MKSRARLSLYSLILSLILCGSYLSNGLSLPDLAGLLLILPLPLYFLLEFPALSRRATKLQRERLQHELYSDGFSFWAFLTQPSPAFRMCLVLLFLLTFTTISRTYAQSLGGL